MVSDEKQLDRRLSPRQRGGEKLSWLEAWAQYATAMPGYLVYLRMGLWLKLKRNSQQNSFTRDVGINNRQHVVAAWKKNQTCTNKLDKIPFSLYIWSDESLQEVQQKQLTHWLIRRTKISRNSCLTCCFLRASPEEVMPVLSPCSVASAASSSYISAAIWLEGKPAFSRIGAASEVRSSLSDHAHRASPTPGAPPLQRGCKSD